MCLSGELVLLAHIGGDGGEFWGKVRACQDRPAWLRARWSHGGWWLGRVASCGRAAAACREDGDSTNAAAIWMFFILIFLFGSSPGVCGQSAVGGKAISHPRSLAADGP